MWGSMRDLTEAVQDYVGSEYYLFLDPALKEYAESLLHAWCEQIGDEVAPETVGQALKAVGTLGVPVDARKAFPDVLRDFFDFLKKT